MLGSSLCTGLEQNPLTRTSGFEKARCKFTEDRAQGECKVRTWSSEQIIPKL